LIKSWKNSATRQFAETGKSGFPGLDVRVAARRLRTLSEVSSLAEISPLKSVGLHKLTGNRKGQWAMTINGPWRLTFEFKDGDAYEVEIADYH
jgi:proteic killer suppression protein